MPPKHTCVMVDRITNLEGQITETRKGQAKILTAISAVATQSALTNQAIAGNGVKGLADRMSEQEKATDRIERHAVSPEKVEEIARAVVHAVIENARHRERTFIGKVKAFAPYAIPGVMLIIFLLENLFHWTQVVAQ